MNDAENISAKPMTSVPVGTSSSRKIEEMRPITGDDKAPSEAVEVGSRLIMWNQR